MPDGSSQLVSTAPPSVRFGDPLTDPLRACWPTALQTASDAELGCALIAGDAEAASVAWQRFFPLVARILRRKLGGRVEVEDTAQAVFLCLFRRVHTLRDPMALRGFVIGITLRIAREEVRRRCRLKASQRRNLEQEGALVVHADAGSKHALANLRRLLGRLRDRERLAFTLRFVEGLDAPEIADALGVSVPTARRCFSRALDRVNLWAGRDPFLVDYMRQ